MSAYVVDREHIRYLVDAGLAYDVYWYHGGEPHRLGSQQSSRPSDDPARVGKMLWDENIASVSHRYPDDSWGEWPGPIGENYIYGRHVPYVRLRFDPVEVIKAAHCLDYQSCEHPGWRESEARAYVEGLIHKATQLLEGYDAAEWGAPQQCYQQRDAINTASSGPAHPADRPAELPDHPF